MKVICRLDNQAIKNDTVEIRSCGDQFPSCVQIVKDDACVVVNAYELKTAVDNCIRDNEYPVHTYRNGCYRYPSSVSEFINGEEDD